jgi:MFS family permease
VPSYALIVREVFPPAEAGARVGIVIMATLFGMALGGWMSGLIFDLTGSYQAAFLNGLVWTSSTSRSSSGCCRNLVLPTGSGMKGLWNPLAVDPRDRIKQEKPS